VQSFPHGWEPRTWRFSNREQWLSGSRRTRKVKPLPEFWKIYTVILHLKDLGLTLTEIALLLSDRDKGILDEQAVKRMAGEVTSKIDERIAGLQVIRGYVAPVAMGDMSVLQDEDCSFVVEFMTALTAEKIKRRA
jgi:hypothetical protein